jgi:hypothetical protein
MVSQVESCYATEQDYQKCDTSDELSGSGAEPTGLDFGTADGQVNVTSSDPKDYTVIAYSKSTNDFTIARSTGGAVTRSCSATSKGACPSNGSW